MVITGYARKLAGDLAPYQVVDAGTAATGDPALLSAHCLASVDPSFAERSREGDVLVLDGALAGGEGAEAAVIALQAAGVVAVVCAGLSPEMAELEPVYGLSMVIAPEAAASIAEGALVRLDLERGRLEAAGEGWAIAPRGLEVRAGVRRALLLARMRRVVEDEDYAG